MRAILLLLIVVVVGAILAFASGFLHLNQTRSAEVPSVALSNGAVVTKGGRSPSFAVETGSVSVGTRQKEVTLPKVALPVPSFEVNRPGKDAQAAAQASSAAAQANSAAAVANTTR
ncbi:MAG: hypothetical protein ABIQ98_04965 [Sphingomicrobium sp.]